MSFLTGSQPRTPRPVVPEPPPPPVAPPAAALPASTPTAFSPGKPAGTDPYAAGGGIGSTILTSPLGTKTKTAAGKALIGM